MNYDVLIVGAGASGLYCACRILSKRKVHLAVIDSNDSAGKKLLLTGAGRCNLTNADIDSKYYMTDTPDMLKGILDHHSSRDALDFFRDELGVLTSERNGLFYPSTFRADTVVNAMCSYLADKGAEFIFKTFVTDIVKEGDEFIINSEYRARTVVIAVGGATYMDTGSVGSIGQVVSHLTSVNKLIPLHPALVPLKTLEKDITSISGARSYCDLVLYEDRRTDKVLARSSGEILFTLYGVSGICVLDVSGHAVKAMSEGKRPVLSVNFLKMTHDEAIDAVRHNVACFADRTPSKALNGLIRDDILAIILDRLGLGKYKRALDLTDDDIERLAECMTAFKLTINGSLSFENAQVTMGGLSMTSFTSDLEFKQTPGGFVCGESLNCNGICGGYNLQFCWSSAAAAADGVLKCLN